jgi:hypothetical protein
MAGEMVDELANNIRQPEDGQKTSALSVLETSPWLFEMPLICHNLSCKVLDLHSVWGSRGKDSQPS